MASLVPTSLDIIMSISHVPSHSDTVCIENSLAVVNLPSEQQSSDQRFRDTYDAKTALVCFVSKAPHNSRYLDLNSERYMIVEEQLNFDGLVAHKLVSRYQNTAIDLKIVLHKPILVNSVIRLMTDLEHHQELFERTHLLVMPEIYRDPKIFEWIAESPYSRLPRVKSIEV